MVGNVHPGQPSVENDKSCVGKEKKEEGPAIAIPNRPVEAFRKSLRVLLFIKSIIDNPMSFAQQIFIIVENEYSFRPFH